MPDAINQVLLGAAVAQSLCDPQSCPICGDDLSVVLCGFGDDTRSKLICIGCEDMAGARQDAANDAAENDRLADLEERGFSRE